VVQAAPPGQVGGLTESTPRKSASVDGATLDADQGKIEHSVRVGQEPGGDGRGGTGSQADGQGRRFGAATPNDMIGSCNEQSVACGSNENAGAGRPATGQLSLEHDDQALRGLLVFRSALGPYTNRQARDTKRHDKQRERMTDLPHIRTPAIATV
jgi:hypothetical protein